MVWAAPGTGEDIAGDGAMVRPEDRGSAVEGDGGGEGAVDLEGRGGGEGEGWGGGDGDAIVDLDGGVGGDGDGAEEGDGRFRRRCESVSVGLRVKGLDGAVGEDGAASHGAGDGNKSPARRRRSARVKLVEVKMALDRGGRLQVGGS